MDKLNSVRFKENLLKAVRMDYKIELYNESDDFFTISFSHLNSVYNGLATVQISTDYINVDFQYHAKNKQIEKIIIDILKYVRVYKKLKKHYNWIIKELEFYNALSDRVYESKYSIDIIIHTEH